MTSKSEEVLLMIFWHMVKGTIDHNKWIWFHQFLLSYLTQMFTQEHYANLPATCETCDVCREAMPQRTHILMTSHLPVLFCAYTFTLYMLRNLPDTSGGTYEN